MASVEFEPDIEEDERRRAAGQCGAKAHAVGEFLGVDAGAVQHERQEMPHALVGVDQKAKRHAPLAVLRGGLVRKAGRGGVELRRVCVHGQAW